MATTSVVMTVVQALVTLLTADSDLANVQVKDAKPPQIERETIYFSGIQLQIVEFFWKSRHGAPLSWAEVKRRTLTASKGIDDAFKGRDWSQWIERVGHGKLKLRTSTSA